MLEQPPPDLPPQALQGISLDVPPPTASDTNLGMLVHLTGLIGNFIGGGLFGWVGPLVIWKTQNPPTPFVEFHAKQALNHHITLAITMAVLGIMMFVLSFLCIGILLIIPIGIIYVASIVFEIIATIDASKGSWYRYPMSIDLIK